MKRYVLVTDTAARRWRLQTLSVEALPKDPLEEYGWLGGEALAQYLLRQDMGSMVVARGPLPFLAGNKATIGYRSPLTGVPHYSFVGGRVAAQLLALGLDAIWLRGGDAEGTHAPRDYLVISGRAPDLQVEWKPVQDLPLGQRAAFHHLVATELQTDQATGSVLAIGTGAYWGYRSANLAADAIFHAGRGGAGATFARFAASLVLRGAPISAREFFPADSLLSRNPNATIKPLLDRYCARLSGTTGGTIVKLAATGADPQGANTLPARYGRRTHSEGEAAGAPWLSLVSGQLPPLALGAIG